MEFPKLKTVKQLKIAFVVVSGLVGGVLADDLRVRAEWRELRKRHKRTQAAHEAIYNLNQQLFGICEREGVEITEFDMLAMKAIVPDWVVLPNELKGILVWCPNCDSPNYLDHVTARGDLKCVTCHLERDEHYYSRTDPSI